MMRETNDLFGEPLLKRSALFPAPGIGRRLSRDLGQGRRKRIRQRALIDPPAASAAEAVQADG